MYRHGRLALIGAGGAALLAAMLLIPGGDHVAVADTAPLVAGNSSQETIAAIDAMLGTGGPELPPQEFAATDSTAVEPPSDPNLRTAALTTPEPEIPAIDPSLRPDRIGPSAVNLRTGPSSSTQTVGVLQPGQPVHTGAVNGGWVEITLDDGTSGWVYSRYLASVAASSPVEANEPAAKPDTRTAKAVVKGKTNGELEGRTARIDAALVARAKPNGGARSVFRTEPGERVKILDVRGNWLRIITADGSSGWIERAS